MQLTANGLYGAPAPPQPETGASTGADKGDAGVRTEARQSGPAGDPTIWLVGLVGLTILLVASVRLEVQVDA